MKILTLPVGQMQTNCYIVIDKQTDKALIIDPGDDGDYIIRRIQDENIYPIRIVATHGHFDHIMAATELKLAFDIPFALHPADRPILARHQSTAKHFLGITVDPPPIVDESLEDGKTISVGDTSFAILATPGHTPGSICLYNENGHLISGDTIFACGGVGRTDLLGGNQKQLFTSIKTKLFSFPNPTIIYPGHGEKTTIGTEKELHNRL